MIRDNLYTFQLQLTTLSPVHIGTGEIYEPTNFVIENKILYEFDEVEFYNQLSLEEKEEFNKVIENWIDIRSFYGNKIEYAKKIKSFHCVTTEKVDSDYKKITNQDGTQNTNQFQIFKTFKNPNTNEPIIPGSSLKGMLETIFKIYSPKSSNKTRQKLLVSDALMIEGGIEIGYTHRIHKKADKQAKKPLRQMVEIIKQNSVFLLTITTEYTFVEIQKMVKEYYAKRKESIVIDNSDGFVARVGKYCGLAYMVDDIKHGVNSYKKPVATHTVYETNNRPFGWIEIEDIIVKKEKLEKEKQKEQKRLDALSPFERVLEELIENNKNINEGYNIIVLRALKAGKLDDCRYDALIFIQEIMKKENRWKEISTAKNPAKDNLYQRTLEILGLLEEVKKNA